MNWSLTSGCHGHFCLLSFVKSVHVEIGMGSPFGACDMAKPGGDQHHGRVAVREVAHHTLPFIVVMFELTTMGSWHRCSEFYSLKAKYGQTMMHCAV